MVGVRRWIAESLDIMDDPAGLEVNAEDEALRSVLACRRQTDLVTRNDWRRPASVMDRCFPADILRLAKLGS
jgi:hypothetical protein